MPKEPKLPPFEEQTKLITEMLNDMVKEGMISVQTVKAVAFSIVCEDLSKMPRKDYKQQYKQIELVAKVMRAKAMNDLARYGEGK